MNIMTIFAIQFLMSVAVWGTLVYWILAPWLKGKSDNETLFFLTLPYAFRTHRDGISCSERRGWTAARNVCRSRSLWRLTQRCVGIPCTDCSAGQLVSSHADCVDLQNRGDNLLDKCTPIGRHVDDRFRSCLVYSDHDCAVAVGNTSDDLFQLLNRRRSRINHKNQRV